MPITAPAFRWNVRIHALTGGWALNGSQLAICSSASSQRFARYHLPTARSDAPTLARLGRQLSVRSSGAAFEATAATSNQGIATRN